MSSKAHTLYRFFAKNGELLYVGRTVDARSRWRTHERTKQWFDDVSSVTRQVYESAELLAAAEVEAIRSERPTHNVVHNGTPRPRKPVSPTPDDLLATRWWNVAGQPNVVEAIATCDDPDLESWCDCASCHDLRMAEVEAIRDEFNFDPTVGSYIDALMARYRDGECAGTWVCDLLDIRIFRPMELAALSRSAGALPVFAEATNRGVLAECPFCCGQHEHFMSSGHALSSDLESACIYRGLYRVADNDDWVLAQDELLRWLERNETPAA